MSGTAHPGLNLGAAHGKARDRSEKGAFGFWVFLMSDLIIFGILFATYIVMLPARAGGPGPETLFDLSSIGAQTALLLASSFTYGMASLSMKHGGRRAPVALWLALTGVLGAGFITLEMRDFIHMAGEGGVPSRSGWLSALWALVGLHGLHVAAGLLWIAVMLALLALRGLNDAVKSRLLLLGLYWHFLDLAWIGIFTIVFLGGMA
ncbi:cytochrome c oxidase subunit 3 [Oceaniglobus trochenteri]|uniref:cytochrome c oxidase subunit 3 n=1 Tax=Oceaniglobus trochenteri TaxID=2763260 RepID=UPI001CFFC10B|nr:cytochrome c oxidase subunit 3 [Oceaniglobus trochenteri]